MITVASAKYGTIHISMIFYITRAFVLKPFKIALATIADSIDENRKLLSILVQIKEITHGCKAQSRNWANGSVPAEMRWSTAVPNPG